MIEYYTQINYFVLFLQCYTSGEAYLVLVHYAEVTGNAGKTSHDWIQT